MQSKNQNRGRFSTTVIPSTSDRPALCLYQSLDPLPSATSSQQSDIPMDSSHLRNLVLRLYGGQAGNEETAAIQSEVFQLQKTQAAWEIPSHFLSENDPHLRFFGAHTLAIKLSRDFDSVDSSQYSSLKGSLLSWLSASANVAYPSAQSGVASQPSERIVLRKLAVAVRIIYDI